MFRNTNYRVRVVACNPYPSSRRAAHLVGKRRCDLVPRQLRVAHWGRVLAATVGPAVLRFLGPSAAAAATAATTATPAATAALVAASLGLALGLLKRLHCGHGGAHGG